MAIASANQQQTVAAHCYNLNLYFVSDCDDLTEKNKMICLDLQVYLEEGLSLQSDSSDEPAHLLDELVLQGNETSSFLP
ncbi:hypothetical protein EXN66_Car019998 [Channa argus]|uniref:Uncharacterized protein n=1 Tax=Channa argus TaxID=215402 RepID=A0A6G1QPN5_CHAAH|nr:hypothetical protein EXN66_Car019998 [Channa argus]